MRKRAGLVASCVVCWGWFLGSPAEAEDVAALAKRLGPSRGICVLLGDRECRLACALARAPANEMIYYVQLPGEADVAAARAAADKAGLLGTRIFVEEGTPARIGLAANVADALVALGGAALSDETTRVLRPQGVAIAGAQTSVKPIPAGVDDWSHHYHGPDNNTQSLDKLARVPLLTQFVVDPRYAPAPQAAVSAGGRVFMSFGNIAWHQREEPWMNTLMAVNGYNGTLLWKRPLSPGLMVDRCTLIATPSTLFMADEKSCKLLDAATGKQVDEIAVSPQECKGSFWKWMALENGVLYALVGEEEKKDPDARWRRTVHGWPWNEMSEGYNDPARLWGFGKTLVAIDVKTKTLLWKFQEDPAIDSRTLSMTAGRIYFCNFGNYVQCVDAKYGTSLWKRTAAKDPEVFKGIGRYRPEQGPIQGWKSNNYMKSTEKALYFAGPQVPWLSALSAEDGRFLWKHPARDLHIVIRDDGLYTIGPATVADETKKLDPMTGKVLATYPLRRRSCTRATGSADSIFMRGHEGSGRFDVASGRTAWISAMRPSCQVGVLIAGGNLYWVPWACDCDLQLFGVIACASAGDLDVNRKAVESERLKRSADAALAGFDVSPTDWPTYRADNARSGRSGATVPKKIKSLWKFESRVGVEPTAPVAAGGIVFFSGSDGIVRALDAATGQPRWTAYTGGPVQYPPTIAEGRVFVGSGDGWAYAFEAATGKLLWRFRAAPIERKIPFYTSLMSTWPVASGVLVDKGTAYFAAGITDNDGTHVYALDAATGAIRWQNNTAGHLDAFSRRGVACQGEMLLSGGRLYLAGGNTVSPGVFDVATGKCLNHSPTTMGGTAPRGRELVLTGTNVKVVGQPLYSRSEAPVFEPSVHWDDPVVHAANARITLAQRRGGGRYAVAAQGAGSREPLWVQPLPAEPVRWGIAMDAKGRVFVALRNGQVLALGQ